jgi:hypothetical protein
MNMKEQTFGKTYFELVIMERKVNGDLNILIQYLK